MPIYNPTTINANLLASTDNAYDIGAEGANRPKDIYAAGNITTGGGITATGTVSAGFLTSGDTLEVTGDATVGGALEVGGAAVLVQISDPGAPASNTIRLHARDNGGSSTLGLRCEQAVAVDVVTASTHTLTVLINNVAYKILLST
jgi:hypothetical protein